MIDIYRVSQNYLIASPVICTFGAIIFGVLSRNAVILGFGILTLACNGLNFTLKQIVSALYPNALWCQRPSNYPKNGCGEFPGSNVISDDKAGFPSGHAQFAFMFATFFTLVILLPYHNVDLELSDSTSCVVIPIIWTVAFLICNQRMNPVSPCHSPMQVFYGAALGLVLGTLCYIALCKVL